MMVVMMMMMMMMMMMRLMTWRNNEQANIQEKVSNDLIK
jgi:hypothetical protein